MFVVLWQIIQILLRLRRRRHLSLTQVINEGYCCQVTIGYVNLKMGLGMYVQSDFLYRIFYINENMHVFVSIIFE
jgi:hypothetical protein